MKKPNVVLILIDDMGFKDLSCYGSSFYETPNIDNLAKEGVLFSNAYASCPVCSPSRVSLLTGKYPARVGVTDWIGAHTQGKLIDAPYIDHLPLEEDNLAKIFSRSGYQTYHVGKWHMGTEEYYPDKQGFDVNIGGCAMGNPHHGYFSPYQIPTLPDGPDGEYLTDRLTDEAVSHIKSSKDRPFFLFLSHYTVHTPIQAKEEDIQRFKEKAKRLHLDERDPFVFGEHFPCEHKQTERVCRRVLQSDPTYAAMIYNLDQNVGKVVQTLKDEGLYNDTILLFTSDNGGLSTAEGSPTCNLPAAEGKGWVYDGGIREPLLMLYPAQPFAARVIDTPVTTPDILPTLLALCDIPLPPADQLDGVSMVPLLHGAQSLERACIFWHYPHYGNQGGTPAAAVQDCDSRYKLIRFFEDEHLELYDLKNDVSETFNCAAQHPQIVRDLEQKLQNWLDSVHALIPQQNPHFHTI